MQLVLAKVEQANAQDDRAPHMFPEGLRLFCLVAAAEKRASRDRNHSHTHVLAHECAPTTCLRSAVIGGSGDVSSKPVPQDADERDRPSRRRIGPRVAPAAWCTEIGPPTALPELLGWDRPLAPAKRRNGDGKQPTSPVSRGCLGVTPLLGARNRDQYRREECRKGGPSGRSIVPTILSGARPSGQPWVGEHTPHLSMGEETRTWGLKTKVLALTPLLLCSDPLPRRGFLFILQIWC